jgi:hypothetical protein
MPGSWDGDTITRRRARDLAAVAPGVAHQVPEDLVEVLAVEEEALRRAHLHVDALLGDPFGAAELVREVGEVGARVDRLGLRAVPAVEVEDLLHDAVEAGHVAADDREEPLLRIVHRLGLGKQVRGMADGREGVADLVRDRRGEAPEGHELHLLRLLAHAPHVLDEHHRRRRVAAADRHEVHLQLAREARAAQLHERRRRALAPGVQERGDLGA